MAPSEPEPSDYWLSNLAADTPLRDLVRLAKIRTLGHYLVCAEYEDLPTPHHDYRAGPLSSRAVRAGPGWQATSRSLFPFRPPSSKPGVPCPWSTSVKSRVDHGGDANGAGLRLASLAMQASKPAGLAR
jgi:hypothetical protein